jgi:hypothetical protein
MKSHMLLLARLKQISPILALRALFPWEVPVLELNDGTTILENEDGTRQLRDAQARPLISARPIGDDIQISVQDALLLEPNHPLSLCVALLGVAKNPMRMNTETLDDRVLSLDSAWCLLQNFKGKAETAEDWHMDATIKVLEVAAEWHTLRMAVFEDRARKQQLDRIEALQYLVSQPGWPRQSVEKVSLNEEPRGSSLSIKFAERNWPTEVPAMQMNWQVAPPLKAAPLPKGKGASRKVAGVASSASMIPRATKLKEDVLAVLNNVQITRNEVRIVERLSPKLYKAVNDVLTEIGGKWSTPKQAHVFSTSPAETIATAIFEGELLTSKDYEFFPTPPELVAQLLLQVGLEPGMLVLEPQAGEGAIAMAAAEVVGKVNVTCHELMPRNVAHLQGLGFAIERPEDFLQVAPSPRFDRVLLNPPFSGGKDIAHITHAMKFVRPGGRLAAIASTTWQTADNAMSRAFALWVEKHALAIQQIGRGAFKASGTEVPTVLLVLQAPQDEQHEAVEQMVDELDELAAAFL